MRMPLSRGTLLLRVGAVLLAGLAGPATAAAETASPPPFVANTAIPTKGWLYARCGATEVLSRLSARETRDYLADFVIFQNFVRLQYPQASFSPDWPLLVILCDRTGIFRAFGGEENRTSGELPENYNFILVDGSEARAIEQSIRRRYVALAFEQHAESRYPYWLQLGTRELLGQVRIGRNRVEVGNLETSWFQPGPMIDLGRLLALTKDSPEVARRSDGSLGPAYHQATMFMHMCLFGTGETQRTLRVPFARFAARLETEPLSEELFYECFGMGYADMHALLRGYMNGERTRFELQRHSFAFAKPFQVRKAELEEVIAVLEASQVLRHMAAGGTR
jgi:hypothetical protein